MSKNISDKYNKNEIRRRKEEGTTGYLVILALISDDMKFKVKNSKFEKWKVECFIMIKDRSFYNFKGQRKILLFFIKIRGKS
jgi:hypothetical protein